MHFARNVLQLTPNGVIIYTEDDEDLRDSLVIVLGPELKIKVDSRIITRLKKGSHGAEVILHLSDDSHVVEGFLAHKFKRQFSGTLAQQFELKVTSQGDLKATPPFYQISLTCAFIAATRAPRSRLHRTRCSRGLKLEQVLRLSYRRRRWGTNRCSETPLPEF